MTHSTLRAIWVVITVALIAVVAAAWTADVGTVEHDRYSRDLRRVQELDARLDEEVAEARLGLVTHYDALVRVSDQMRAARADLARVPSFLGGGDRAALERRLALLDRAIEDKADLVEDFKTEHSVLRNSVHAFPHNVDRLRAALATEPEAGPTSELVDDLEHDVMLAIVVPSHSHTAAAQASLDAFPDALASRPDFSAVLVHAELILKRQPVVDQLISDIAGSRVPERAGALIERYTTLHERAQAAARTRWIIAFVLALASLVAGAAFIIARLSSSAHALRDAAASLQKALRELEIERDRAQDLAQLKSQFVSMTSHEFRTPLSHILSSSELLETYGEQWPKEKRALHFGRVQTAAKDMSRMLDQVLLIGRADAGMLELNPQPVRLGELCSGIVEETRAVAGKEREIAYVCEAPSGDAWLDERLLRHVLGNLLTNALKYSPGDSKVDFRVKQNGEAALFEIADRGIGIPPEDRPHLFEAFHRCRNAGQVPGTGLGLAVVKRSLEVHGGTIDVESEVGVGTTFKVRVPFRPAAAGAS